MVLVMITALLNSLAFPDITEMHLVEHTFVLCLWNDYFMFLQVNVIAVYAIGLADKTCISDCLSFCWCLPHVGLPYTSPTAPTSKTFSITAGILQTAIAVYVWVFNSAFSEDKGCYEGFVLQSMLCGCFPLKLMVCFLVTN